MRPALRWVGPIEVPDRWRVDVAPPGDGGSIFSRQRLWKMLAFAIIGPMPSMKAIGSGRTRRRAFGSASRNFSAPDCGIALLPTTGKPQFWRVMIADTQPFGLTWRNQAHF
jgi:hypothetical protein